mmetsp:Transcript_11612/g.13258  ORF Transcript_11612/g.13258 Transcript_11612/m.13258 type:complete len:370 (-) Transcript_11612:400-1509(-)
MNDQENVLAGKIGLFISILLCLLCTWRLCFHTCWDWIIGVNGGSTENEQRYTVPSVRWFTRRRSFHVLLWMSVFCEVVSYADLSGLLPFTSDRVLADIIGYVILHVVARTLELLAFCTVSQIWLIISINADPRSLESRISNEDFLIHWLPPIFMLFTALLVITSVSLSVVIFCRYPHAPIHESISIMQERTTILLYGINILMVILSIDMTLRWIFILIPSTDCRRRLYLICKAVGPMLISCLAYATRFVWLIATYMDQDRRDGWAWWISFSWTPTIVVSIMLLYSVRKRDSIVEFEMIENEIDTNVVGSSEDNLQQSLLRPQPPAEAFRSFHIFRRGDEDMDDSFSLSSPMPRNQLKGDGEESSTTVIV